MRSLVSILIPAYNAEKWIRDCVCSAKAQTWPHKEIIVVDDGSSDRTLKIARTLESSEVKVVAQENTGACGARNKAFSLAQGDYIQWLDADDALHPEKIARQLQCLSNGQVHSTLLTSTWGKFFYSPDRTQFISNSLWQDLSAVDWLVTKFADNVWMNPACWLISRQLIEAAGPWDERLSVSGNDDGEYICRVVAASTGVKFVADAKCYYRIGVVGSLSWNKERSEESLNQLLLTLKLSIDHLLGLENSERTRQASMQYLRTSLPHFYGSDSKLLNNLLDVANALGGSLYPPRPGWKYYPLEKIVGPRATKKVMNNWRAAKLRGRGKVDWYLYRMSRYRGAVEFGPQIHP
jgi:glycosyltransferase involved in cell wall biosynthesis